METHTTADLHDPELAALELFRREPAKKPFLLHTVAIPAEIPVSIGEEAHSGSCKTFTASTPRDLSPPRDVREFKETEPRGMMGDSEPGLLGVRGWLDRLG